MKIWGAIWSILGAISVVMCLCLRFIQLHHVVCSFVYCDLTCAVGGRETIEVCHLRRDIRLRAFLVEEILYVIFEGTFSVGVFGDVASIY